MYKLSNYVTYINTPFRDHFKLLFQQLKVGKSSLPDGVANEALK